MVVTVPKIMKMMVKKRGRILFFKLGVTAFSAANSIFMFGKKHTIATFGAMFSLTNDFSIFYLEYFSTFHMYYASSVFGSAFSSAGASSMVSGSAAGAASASSSFFFGFAEDA